MRLKDTFITHETDGTQVLVDTQGSFSGLVRSNKTAAFIVDCLKTETNIEEIVSRMMEKYDGNKDVITADVERVVSELKRIGAVE